MPNSIILNDHKSIPQLGFGVYLIANNEAELVVTQAIETGYRLIDSAAFYQNEQGVGKALKNSKLPREDFFITTKLWNEDQGYERAFLALEQSLEKLNLSYLDLYLIHWPSPHKKLFVETWQALIEMRDQGKTKSIGVSNFAIEHLEEIISQTGVVPAVNQIELHPRFQQKALRAFHEKHGIKTESWGPLGRAKFLSDPVLLAIAAKHKKTSAQIILRWQIQNGLIAIPKSSKLERMRENFAIFDFSLDDQDLQMIDGLDSKFGRQGPHPSQNDF